MKGGTCGMPIKCFVGLKINMHTFIAEENHESKKVKDIRKTDLDDEVKYENYKNVLFIKSHIRHEMKRI